MARALSSGEECALARMIYFNTGTGQPQLHLLCLHEWYALPFLLLPFPSSLKAWEVLDAERVVHARPFRIYTSHVHREIIYNAPVLTINPPSMTYVEPVI